MDNPNNLFREQSEDDPTEECLSLQEYICEILVLLGKCEAYLISKEYDLCLQAHIECLELVKEMSQGNWRVIANDYEE